MGKNKQCGMAFIFAILFTTGIASLAIAAPVFSKQANNKQPQRIASINLCTDQYLLLLAEPSSIATVTWLSHEQDSSYYYSKAINYPANHGEVEEVITYKPDLVLAGSYSSRTTNLLKQLGYRVELFSHPENIQQAKQQLRRVAALIDQTNRADIIIKEMDARLAKVASPPTANAPTLMQYAPGGFTVGRNSLVGDIMHKAGWYNKASDAGIKTNGVVDLETLLLLSPQALIDSPLSPHAFSFAEYMVNHPVIKKMSQSQENLTIERTLWNCGGPMNVDAIIALRDARLKFKNINHE